MPNFESPVPESSPFAAASKGIAPVYKKIASAARPAMAFMLWPFLQYLLPLLLQAIVNYFKQQGEAGRAQLDALFAEPESSYHPAVRAAIAQGE